MTDPPMYNVASAIICRSLAIVRSLPLPGCGHILVFFNRHCSTINLVKEKQRGLPPPPGLKRWPFKLIKHFANTTHVSPSPVGPAGCCPLDFLNLTYQKFRVRAPNGCCILLFRPNQSFVCNFLSTPRCKSQVPVKKKQVYSCWKRFLRHADPNPCYQ